MWIMKVDMTAPGHMWKRFQAQSYSSLFITVPTKAQTLKVFNLTKKGRVEKIYSFEEVCGCKFTTIQIIQTDIFITNLIHHWY